MIRRLHSLIHHHTFVAKDGIGEIVVCWNRVTRRMDVHVTVGGCCYLVRRATAADLSRLTSATSAVDLHTAAFVLVSAR